MKKVVISVACTALFLFGNASSLHADSVAVEGDKIFIAAGGLSVKNLLDGQPNQCLASPYLDPEGNDVTDLLVNATDVVIQDDVAVVTTETLVDGVPVVDVVVVDVSSCVVHEEVIAVSECISTVDIEEGILIIPCVEINGTVNTVHMERRGSSSNWEVSFFGDNPVLNNYSSDEDDEEDEVEEVGEEEVVAES